MSYSPYAYSTATGTTLGLTKIGGNLSAAVDGTITVGTNEVFTLLTATGQVSLAGAAGAESLRVITQASAVNRVEIKGAITSNAPIISANGSDSLINLNFSSKGGTGMAFYGNSGANTLFTAAYTSSAVNWLQLANSATGNAVAVSAQGGDSNVNLNLTAYGTSGVVKVTNTVAASSTATGALQVAGGIGANQIYGSTVFDNSNRVITTVTPTAGTGINVSSLTSSGPTASFTINNLGVTSLTGAATIAVSASTGSVTLTNLGPTSVSAGTGISVNQSTGSVIVTNAGVTAFNGSTGAVLGVASITGTSNQVTASASTGSVTLSLPQSISTTSAVTFASVTATNGISFKNPSATVNSTLNDYESGTWIPTYVSSGGGETVTYGVTVNTSSEYAGTYTKIGNMVYCQFTLYVTGVSGGSGNFLIGGLPFPQASGTLPYGCGSFGTINNISHTGNKTQFGMRIEGGVSQITVWEFGLASGATGDNHVPWSSVPNAQSNITGFISYRANF
jgi:trimeric autotransporter adhesin